MLGSRRWIAIAGVLVGIVLLAPVRPAPARAADPDALWKIVHGRCVPEQETHGDPAPCAQVDLAAGWSVLKDIVGATQFLLIPTARVTGIEDPLILAPDAPNYWEAAWAARHFVEQRAPASLGPDDIALAINSAEARSQNQLHIHVDCIRADIRADLRAAQPRIGADWSPIRLAEQGWTARRIDASELSAANLFGLVARTLPAGEAMGAETMVLVGTAAGGAGFDLVVGRAGVDNRGHGEDLQDHDCAVAGRPGG